MHERLLIVEDDLYQRTMLAGHLAEMDCEVVAVSSGARALELLSDPDSAAHGADLAIVSSTVACEPGRPLFREILRRHADVPLLMISDQGSLQDATLAMREGAYDYLTRPFESLDIVGLRVARVLERVRLVRENQEFRRHIEYDLDLARSIQQRFLPSGFPAADRIEFGAHYTACSIVGGDLYDAVPIADGLAGAAIVDVSGHGVSAALVTVILKIGLQAFLESAGSAAASLGAAAVLEHLSGRLLQHTATTQFATMAYARIDAENQSLLLSSAGHCHPILLEPGGRASFVKTNHGVPLGVIRNPGYGEDEVPFPVGSTLLLYTDGVTEARNVDGDFWGTDALLETAARNAGSHPQELVDAVIRELDQFTPRVGRDDDVTMLAFRLIR